MKNAPRFAPPIISNCIFAIIATFVMQSQTARADATIGYTAYATESLNVALAKAALDAATTSGDSAAIAAAQSKLNIAKANAAKATPFQLAVARNHPFILIENSSTSEDITNFTLSIQDPTQTFASAQLITADSTSIPDIVSPNSGASQTLELNFLSSQLAPGGQVVIQVNLDPVDPNGYQFADYRNVLFKFSDSSQNAVTTAHFDDGSMLTQPWDPQTYPSNFGNPILGLQFPSQPHGDHVMGFETLQVETQPVPEPAAILLAGLGAAGLIVMRQAARKRHASL